ncbi:uncharacterized protein LOC125238046 [Leguminivora glycinivorella]|uniref:uncharacterized protein LOC125238046 n=1 Tax=Leguminivora glycinivorella TaxID=1035111 RepID=UPI00200EB067|nr:uncharacterized protein LOC125238046 [Leguminivora glycinivorella]
MQKSLVIVLAVCLLSVHAFVKRDAPAPATAADTPNYLEDIQKQLGDIGKQVSDKLKETFNPDEIKKGLNDAVNSIGKALEDLKAKSETAKKE